MICYAYISHTHTHYLCTWPDLLFSAMVNSRAWFASVLDLQCGSSTDANQTSHSTENGSGYVVPPA